jgi:hypothetical protein
MTNGLHEQLDDLLLDIPAHVPAADPGAAWRAGGRRRLRRRVTTSAAVLAVVALLSAAGLVGSRVVEVQPAGGGSGSSATSYPARIDKPLLHLGTLPDRPGPVAGLVQRDDGWLAIGQTGAVWRVPGAAHRPSTPFLASISPDGRRIAYVDASHGQSELTLLDLVDGGALTPDVGATGSHAWLLKGRGQTFWSPDSSRLLVPVRRVDGGPRHVAALVVGPGPATTEVRAPAGRRVEPIGWLSPTRLGWLRWTSSPLRPDIVTTGARGGRVLSTAHSPTRIPRNQYVDASPVPGGDLPSHVLSVTTATRQILISNPGRRADSALVASRPVSPDRVVRCPASWTADFPVLPISGADDFFLLRSGNGSYAVQLDPSLLPAYCSVWATSALQGGPHEGIGGRLFGERVTWLSWHWRQVAVAGGALGVLVAAGGVLLLGRRRRRRTAEMAGPAVGRAG